VAVGLAFHAQREAGDSVLAAAHDQIARWREHLGVSPNGAWWWLAAFTVMAGATGIPPTAPVLIALGALLGPLPALTMGSIATTTGFYLAFLFGRYGVRVWLKGYMVRWRSWIEKFDRHGESYLFSVRLLPVLPSTMVSTVVGLSGMRTSRFLLITFVARIPLTVGYVMTGAKISEVRQVSDLYSPTLMGLLMVGAFGPHLARIWWNRRQAAARTPAREHTQP
jgi:uncharacterized membrane protein YdjX (TVP38/TMEM64 family)